MAGELDSLMIRVEADTTPLRAALAQADRTIAGFASSVDRSLGKFEKRLSAGMAGQIRSMTAAFGAAQLAMKAFAAVDLAGEINDLSRNANLSTKAFQEFAYAAAKAGTSQEDVARSTRKFAVNMAELRSNTGALNQFLKQHLPMLRQELLATDSLEGAYGVLADGMATLKDEGDKSTLAVRAFGKTGADLVEVLENGSNGLRNMADEAERLGAIQSGSMLDSAEKLKESYTSLTTSIEAGWQRAVVSVWEYLKATNQALHQMGKAAGLGSLVQPGAQGAAGGSSNVGAFAAPGLAGARMGGSKTETALLPEAGNSWAASIIPPTYEEQLKEFEDQWRAVHEAAMMTLTDIIESDTTPIEDKVNALTDAVKNGEIGWRDYLDGMRTVNQQSTALMDDLLSTTSQTLGAIFKESKTAAIAQALINTYQGITKALTLPPPYSFAMAALTAAQGFAAVSSIRSQSQSGGGGGARPSVASGGGSSAAAAPAAQAQSQTLTVQGLNKGAFFDAKTMREFAAALIEHQRNGGKILLA